MSKFCAECPKSGLYHKTMLDDKKLLMFCVEGYCEKNRFT